MADGRSTRTKSIAASIASVEDPALQLGPILRGILQHNDQIVEQNKAILQLLNYHVKALPRLPSEPVPDLPAHAVEKHIQADEAAPQATHEKPEQSEHPEPAVSSYGSATQVPSHEDGYRIDRDNIWEGIFDTHSRQSPRFVRDFHEWLRPSSLRDVFLGKHEWTSKSFAWAYPDLVQFLDADGLARRCRSQVVIKDLMTYDGLLHTSAYSEARPRVGTLRDSQSNWQSARKARRKILGRSADDPFACALLWEALDTTYYRRSAQALLKESGHMRSVNVLDLSAKVLMCLLASTPRTDLSYMAAFVQRHLASANWGKANRLRFGDSMHSFTLEYHFSFFYVTPKRSQHDTVRLDPRRLRKSSSFSHESTAKTRYIHEESLSFLLIGHYSDVATCVQLAESYFKFDPYHVGDPLLSQPSILRPLSNKEAPALLLLNWITVALHHVLWRWQGAIEAVHAEIKTSRQLVFMQDRSNLMADDPQQTLSKTYFWALQAYKLFEDTIGETIATWHRFRDESLLGMRDRRIPHADWQKSVQDIEDAVSELERKLCTINTRVEEIKDLRRGLLSATALFDSQISVRQGDNIRLLTYVSVLCLPLSFATSIFGMHIVGNSRTVLYTCVAVLPATVVAAAFLALNLQNIVRFWTKIASSTSMRLRKGMVHSIKDKWKSRAERLRRHGLETKAPVRKTANTSSWLYAVFILEFIIAGLPVGEMRHAISVLSGRPRASPTLNGGVEEDERMLYAESKRAEVTVQTRIKASMLEYRRRQRWERRKRLGTVLLVLAETWEAIPSAIAGFLGFLWTTLRIALVPFWCCMITVDFFLLLLFFLILGIFGKPGRWPCTLDGHPQGPRHRAYFALGLDSIVNDTQSPAIETIVQPHLTQRKQPARSQQLTIRPSPATIAKAPSSPATPTSKTFETILKSPLAGPPMTAADSELTRDRQKPTKLPNTNFTSAAPRLDSLTTPPSLLIGRPPQEAPATIRISQIPRPLANQPEPRPDTLLSDAGTSILNHPGRSTMDFIEELSRTGPSSPRLPFHGTAPQRGSSRRPSSPTMPSPIPAPRTGNPPAPIREAPGPPAPRVVIKKPTAMPVSPVESSFSVSRPGTTTADFSPDFAPSLPSIQIDHALISPLPSPKLRGVFGRRGSNDSNRRPVSPIEPSSPASIRTVSTIPRPGTGQTSVSQQATLRGPVAHLGRNLEARAVSLASQRGESIEVLELTKPPKPPPKQ